MLGRLDEIRHNATTVWELTLTEPEDLVTPLIPPGLARRQKQKSPERKSFERRRQIQQRDLTEQGRLAEELAVKILRKDFPSPNYTCLWRDDFLDSERIEIRKIGIIADIDVWNVTANTPERFIEVKAQKVKAQKVKAQKVKAQKVKGARPKPTFHLSSGEWRSCLNAKAEGIKYEIWLFQYTDMEHLKNAPQSVTLLIFDEVSKDWLDPEGYIVTPSITDGRQRKLPKSKL